MTTEKILSIIENFAQKLSLDDSEILLLDYLSEHSDSEVRSSIAELLVSYSTCWSKLILLKLSKDKDYLVRINACDSLCIFAEEDVLTKLIEIISEDKNYLVRSYAAFSVKDIFDSYSLTESEKQHYQEFFKARLNVEHYYNPRIAYMECLYALGLKNYLFEILNLLNNPSYTVRCCVINVLHELVNHENESVIRTYLTTRLQKEKAPSVQRSIKDLIIKIS